MDLFTVNGEGASASDTDALSGMEATDSQSIKANGNGGQAQSYRALKRVINRQLRKDNLAIRGKCGQERIVPLNSFYQVNDLEALADRLGLIPCGMCHRRVANVYRYQCHGVPLCPRRVNGGAR